MREVLESRRLRLSWEKLSRSELTPIERTAALDGVRRILASDGHHLDDVLRMALAGVVMLERERAEKAAAAEAATRLRRTTTSFSEDEFLYRRAPAEARTPDERFGPGFSALGDLFRDRVYPAPTDDGPRTLRPVTGAEVPVQLTGAVRGVDRINVRSNDMLVFQIAASSSLYGPIVAIEHDAIETIEAANRHSATVRLLLRRHGDGSGLNIVEKASIAS